MTKIKKKNKEDKMKTKEQKIFEINEAKEKLENLGLYLTTKNFSRMLFFNEIYRQILNTEGVIMEFGIRWGQNLSILVALRGAYEPYNIKRKIIVGLVK